MSPIFFELREGLAIAWRAIRANKIRAASGGSPKANIKGVNIAIPFTGPIPGIIPKLVPKKLPIKTIKRLVGTNATEKPPNR